MPLSSYPLSVCLLSVSVICQYCYFPSAVCVQQVSFSYLILLKIYMHLAWKKVLKNIQSGSFQLLHWWSCSSWNKTLMLIALNKMRNWSTVLHGWSATHMYWHISLTVVHGWTATHRYWHISFTVLHGWTATDCHWHRYWHISLTVVHGWTATDTCIDILALLYFMSELPPTGVLTY